MLRRLKARFDEFFLPLWQKYERYLVSGSLLIGFIFDLIIADRPDNPLNNTLLLLYLFAAGGLIIALNIHKSRREEGTADPALFLLALQFLFGNLSSNLLVLYGRSGTLAGSAIFLGIFLLMLVGNEFLRTKYGQLRFNIAIYYTLTFSYLILAIPTFILHGIGLSVFIISGIASLVFIAAFLWAVYALVFRGRYRKRLLLEVSMYVLGIYSAFNLLYFFNIIPPVPLSLKEIGIYHSVERVAPGEYRGEYEEPAWFAFWRSTSPTYHLSVGEPAYCFSAIYAPASLTAPVVHTWEKYSDVTKSWQAAARISFAIQGGRGGGYRGFTSKAVTEGKWRCDVETENGQLIGRMEFRVTKDASPELVEREL